VTTVTHSCKNQFHIGPSEDGGWDMCLEQRFDITAPCLVYSFGYCCIYHYRFLL